MYTYVQHTPHTTPTLTYPTTHTHTHTHTHTQTNTNTHTHKHTYTHTNTHTHTHPPTHTHTHTHTTYIYTHNIHIHTYTHIHTHMHTTHTPTHPHTFPLTSVENTRASGLSSFPQDSNRLSLWLHARNAIPSLWPFSTYSLLRRPACGRKEGMTQLTTLLVSLFAPPQIAIWKPKTKKQEHEEHVDVMVCYESLLATKKKAAHQNQNPLHSTKEGRHVSQTHQGEHASHEMLHISLPPHLGKSCYVYCYVLHKIKRTGSSIKNENHQPIMLTKTLLNITN